MAALLFGAGDVVDFGTTGIGGSATAALNGALLTNAVVGDLIVAQIHAQSSGTLITTAAGWARVGAAEGTPNTSAARGAGIYIYPVSSAAALATLRGTHTWTFSITGGRVSCIAARATGIDLDAPVDATNAAFSAFVSGTTSVAVAGVTTVAANTLVVGAVHRQTSGGAAATVAMLTSFGAFTTYRERVTSTDPTVSTSGVALGWYAKTGAGPTGAQTATYSAAVAQLSGQIVAFKAGPWTAPVAPNPGVAVARVGVGGALTTARAYLVNASGALTTPAEVRRLPRGYASVAAMRATQPFYMAHRGGSVAWPEMSLHAYTQAAWQGVGCLEVSCGRTSDGVFFGLHDATLDRTSGVTGVTASALTWAQVQQYQISAGLPGGQIARPYMRLEELFEAYYDTHVLFVDPKALNAAGRTALLDFMDAAGADATSRLVWKFYGVGGSHAPAATARGYTTWGYFYDTDLAVLAANQGQWSMLGMNIEADQAAWDAVKAYGKTVIGHIAATAASASSALAKGANGLQVSNPLLVVPRAA